MPMLYTSCPAAFLFVVALLVGCGSSAGGGGGSAASGGGGSAAGGGGGSTAGNGTQYNVECQQDADCADELFCNGVEECRGGRCTQGYGVECDDGIACTVDVCSEQTQGCESAAPDKDGDGHGDMTCLDANGSPLGDDCDDDDGNLWRAGDCPIERWSRPVGGLIRDLSVGPEGDVYGLRTEAPWVSRYAAEDGNSTDVETRPDLGWAKLLQVSTDGSFYVAGQDRFGGDHDVVQVQHLDAAGELLGSARWELGDPPGRTILGGMSVGPGGAIYVAVSAPFEGIWIGRAGDAEIEPVAGPLRISNFGIEGSAYEFDLNRFAMNEDGDYMLAGSGEAAWVAFGRGNQGYGGILIDDWNDGIVGGIDYDHSGGFYWSYGEGWTNAYSGLGNFLAGVRRSAADGTEIWAESYGLDPSSRTEPDSYYRTTAVAGLKDSVIFGLSSTEAVAGGESPPYVSRWARDGAFKGPVKGIGPLVRALGIAPLAAALLGRDGELRVFDFPELEIELKVFGANCSEDAACESGLCCFDAATGSGTCGRDVCAAGAICAADDECAEGLVCPLGYCASPCGASAECPAEMFCVDGTCLDSCANDQECEIAWTTCADATNAENLTVSICR